MASIFQGEALPSVQTTQSATTTAPDWYNQFLSGLASGAQQAVQQGGIAPFSPLQTQAFQQAPEAVKAGQPALQAAMTTATGAAGQPDISQFMNPYTSAVVDEIARRGQQNWQQTVAPGVTAGAVGSGQFGSTRGAQTLANAGRDVTLGTTGLQSQALQSGYQNAVQAALQEQQIQNALAQTMGQLSSTGYTQGTGGLSVLSGLGAQQQALEQQRLNYPMTAEANAANIIRGFTVPTSTTQTYSGPMPGAYGLSPLQQILGLTSGVGSLFAPKYSSTGAEIPGSSLASVIGSGLSGGLDWLNQNLFNSQNSTTPINLDYANALEQFY
jgi:hypothetical protein